MKRFYYSAIDQQGNSVSGSQAVTGSIDAEDWNDALRQLLDRGMAECREVKVSEVPRLSTTDAVELAGYLAELSKSGLPLGGVLEAMSKDTASPELQSAIDHLSARLAAGQPIELAVESIGGRLPEHIRQLLVSSARSGRLSQSLQQLLDHQSRVVDMGRRLRQAIAYPLLLLCLLIAWLYFMSVVVLPSLISTLSVDMGFVHQYSVTTEILEFATLWLPTILTTILALLGATVIATLAFGGRAGLASLLSRLPLIGPCYRYRAVTDFTGLLAAFVDEKLPLEEALQLSAGGVHDAGMTTAARAASKQVAQGASLCQAFLSQRGFFPDTLQQWCDWGQSHGQLGRALRASEKLFADRFEQRLGIMRAILPVLIFGLIGASVLLAVAGLYHLVFQFIQNLSGTFHPPTEKAPFDYMPLVIAGLFVAGLLLLLSGQWVRGQRLSTEIMYVLGRFLGICIVLGALLITNLQLFGAFGLLFWIVIVVAWIRIAARFRQAQRQTLWTALSLAAECQAPLAPMALAFADEHRGSVSRAARALARRLAAGMDLSEALQTNKNALPAEAPLAIRIGSQSGDLIGALQATRGNRDGRPLMPAAVVWTLFFMPVFIITVLFMQHKIAAAFIKIFDDFDASLPAITIFLYAFFSGPIPLWGGLILSFVILLLWLQWRGTLQPRIPFLKRLVSWIELGPVLRILSLVARQGQPLPQTLTTIAQFHPRRWVRKRLRAALRDVESGISWQESLQRGRLLSDGDLAVLSAAERNGNLAWALEEMGDSFNRRADFRLKAISEIALPIFLITVGFWVALFIAAYFTPLVNLIQDLSQ